eukprot:Gregarina_sp_Poly_1__1201@NODE_1295_length_4465_cov_43_415643_g875_i0_p1_GENE_NODE_1295_length_4465_cov_43_415643_g875_i0NODE_1295_length_4465_cov_43_415643_g875_i0_p1_ORF_typecomplete_len711_score101_42VCBS/PF13517_6/0_037VCBS/PF13517_6/0_46VCBS/PF13517_6/0_28VCBS/PF13517_6/3_5FGGAP/PF01839_23/8_5e02FGGAP/PF01839_23/2_2FGGAP/PF01839_23/2_6FGGAP/PF01839_23/15FGGAP/PF01839_23/2_7e02FGGAP/PF01839_23/0_44TcdB_toxin_midN/PF12256_8/2_2TcdB_toxin_midN/PF12256_8/2_4e02TcdB_toxin_midN/PF12256_8/67TcdB_t
MVKCGTLALLLQSGGLLLVSPADDVAVGPPAVSSWSTGREWPWSASAYTHSVNDTDERLKSLQSLRGVNATIAAFADYDGDGVSDLLFLIDKRSDNESRLVLQIHCVERSIPPKYGLCLNQTIGSNSAAAPAPFGLLPGGFTQDGSLSFVLLLQMPPLKVARKRRDVAVDRPSGWQTETNFAMVYYRHSLEEDSSGFVPVWDSASPSSLTLSAVPPIVVDIDRDGFPDLLGHDVLSDQRAVWINQEGRGFKMQPWSSLAEFVDLQSYSRLPKADLSQILLSLEYVTANDSGMASSALNYGDKKRASGDGTSVFGFLKNVLHRIGLGNADGSNANADSLEDHFLKRHEQDFHFGLQTNFRWAPRPLPLSEPPRIVSNLGFANLDIDGDCVADLILVVESPDFEGRYELETWLTEASATNSKDIKWRQWKGQRILLPEGTQSIALNDFSNNGGPDLLVLACDPLSSFDGSGVPQLSYDVQPVCEEAERIFLFKLFHPPLCVNPNLMPVVNGGDCRQVNKLCASKPFAFGGIDEGLRRIGISISDIRLPAEIAAGTKSHTRLASNFRFPPIVRTADVDRDGFEDLLLLISSPDGPSFRYLRNVLPTGETSWQAQSSLKVVKQIVFATAFWNAGSPWQDNLQHLLQSVWTSTRTLLQTVTERLLGKDRHIINPLKARRFEPIDTISPPGKARLYAGGFIEDFNAPVSSQDTWTL